MLERLLVPTCIPLAERGLLPDSLVRFGIRRLVRDRDRSLRAGTAEERAARDAALIERLRASAVAEDTDAANAQHYEVSAAFYEHVLGPHLKYSSGIFEEGDETLADGERRALEHSVETACIADGQEVLELGCGWGSLTLSLAERFPDLRLTAVSNSRSQKAFIDARLARIGRADVRVLTEDVNTFQPDRCFDRIVSIEMFEHVRNHERLFERLASWLAPGGALFVHVFRHREHPYLFEVEDGSDWMSREFFTGGLMPSHDLLPDFARAHGLEVAEEKAYPGTHYQRTAEFWLERLDAQRTELEALLAPTGQAGEGRRALSRWRMFFMACAELFGWNAGRDWGVSHYRFEKPRPGSGT